MSACAPPGDHAGVTPGRTPALGLGLDGGGTATRWALAAADGRLLAQGEVSGISSLMLADAAGRARLQGCVAQLAEAAATAASAGASAAVITHVVAGLTGFASADEAAWQALLAAPFGLPATAVQLMTDIELACRAAFAPGEGILVYAGTGSIAAHLDTQGRLLRAGGRGLLIDDAGSGAWIAAQALRTLWRLEDVEPGAAARTVLGQAVFAHLGGADWASVRAWAYGSATQAAASRGELGRLALAVAAAAQQGDTQAQALLQAAGRELAGLAWRLQQQCQARGLHPLPLAQGGRVWRLHPAVGEAFVAALPAGTALHAAVAAAEQAAAHLAAARSVA